MHRLVLTWKLGRPIAPGKMPDHEDGNSLNNQRDNLREVTKRGNGENQHVVKTSQYLGVCWVQRCGKWQAQIWVDGEQIYLGIYATELSAAIARERYIADHMELGAASNLPKILGYQIKENV